MAELNLSGVPSYLSPISRSVERVAAYPSSILQVPAVVGWGLHAGVRIPTDPANTFVCATSYDHICLDVSAAKVRALYQLYPQTQTIITPAGLPDVLSVEQVSKLAQAWGVTPGGVGEVPSLADGAVYAAAPVFLLHRPGQGNEPLAMAACRLLVSEELQHRICVDITLQYVAVAPEVRQQGLAHLVTLEAARWLGMLVRNLRFDDRHQHRLVQRVHGAPRDALGYQLAQAFYSNYLFFGITEELLENTREEVAQRVVLPGSLRAGLGSIRGDGGFEDMILIPDSALALS